MSYCRFAWYGSDVYVFDTHMGGKPKIECCGCKIDETGSFYTDSPEGMIIHLADHRRSGQFVPPHAIASLWEEIPGADEPVEPEPPALTKARLFGERVWAGIIADGEAESAWNSA